MNYNQLTQLAEELHDDPEQVLSEALQELINDKGWSQYTTLKEATQTHSQWLEKRIKNYGRTRN